MREDMIWFLIFLPFLVSVPFSMADFSGTINFTSGGNRSVATGLTGFTVEVCNATSHCMPAGSGLSCFIDYDGTSKAGSGSAGWCNATSITSCFHNNTELGSGTSICITNTTYRTCSSGTWSGVSDCSSGSTCDTNSGTPGNCSSSSSSTTTGTGGSTSTPASTAIASMEFVSWPSDFDIIQGESAVKYAIVKNIGNVTLHNVTLSISGISWYNVSPARIDRLNKSNEATFTISLTIPENLDVRQHTLNLVASAHTSSATASKTFKVNVKPSNKTIQEQIIPDFGQYSSLLSSLEARVSELEASGTNVEEIRGLLLNAKSKLDQANTAMGQEDYAGAKQLIDEAKGLLAAAQNEINTASIIPGFVSDFGSLTFIIIIAVVAGIIAIIVYMMLPPKAEKKEWSTAQKSGTIQKFRNVFRRKNKSKW